MQQVKASLYLNAWPVIVTGQAYENPDYERDNLPKFACSGVKVVLSGIRQEVTFDDTPEDTAHLAECENALIQKYLSNLEAADEEREAARVESHYFHN